MSKPSENWWMNDPVVMPPSSKDFPSQLADNAAKIRDVLGDSQPNPECAENWKRLTHLGGDMNQVRSLLDLPTAVAVAYFVLRRVHMFAFEYSTKRGLGHVFFDASNCVKDIAFPPNLFESEA